MAQYLIRCKKCQRLKIDKTRDYRNKERKIDATPLKYRGLKRNQALSENKSLSLPNHDAASQGYITSSSIQKGMISPQKHRDNFNLVRRSLDSTGQSPNLIRFLQNDNSKTRHLLAKAYNLKLEKQIEVNQKMDPANRFFRLYI